MPCLDLPVAILAGGLATRLRPLTEKIPKALVNVGGQPFLAHQLALLRDQGIRRAVVCAGYLGEMIRDAFGDGSEWGIELEYCFDGPVLLGTGGALLNALPLLGRRFFVLYGDSYLPVDFRSVAEAFEQCGKAGLMTVFRNDNQWDTSNVWYEEGRIKVYDKKTRLPEMRHIDYGLSILSPAAFDGISPGAPCDLAGILTALVARNQLAGFEVFERFHEIGSPAGIAELEQFLAASRGRYR